VPKKGYRTITVREDVAAELDKLRRRVETATQRPASYSDVLALLLRALRPEEEGEGES